VLIDILKNVIRFFTLILLQVIIVKNIELGQFINPFVYVLFIIVLPFKTPNWLMLILSFLLGITLDMFYDTGGIHAAACVLMGYSRASVLKLFSPREGYESGTEPTIKYLGFPWFISYSSILIFIHHFALFFLEIFRLNEIGFTLIKILCSTISTLLLVILIQYFINSKSKKE
jgi:rod shape-determining protein MreD